MDDANKIDTYLNEDEWERESASWRETREDTRLALIQAWMDLYDGGVDDRHHFRALWNFANDVASLPTRSDVKASVVEVLSWMLAVGGAWGSPTNAAKAYREYASLPLDELPNPFRPWNEYAQDVRRVLGLRNE